MYLRFEQVLNISSSIQTKTEFWDHIYSQVEALIDGQRHWVCIRWPYSSNIVHFLIIMQVSNLANASSVIFNALLAFPKFFGRSEDKAVNWCGNNRLLFRQYLRLTNYHSPRLLYSLKVLPGSSSPIDSHQQRCRPIITWPLLRKACVSIYPG